MNISEIRPGMRVMVFRNGDSAYFHKESGVVSEVLETIEWVYVDLEGGMRRNVPFKAQELVSLESETNPLDL